MKNSLKLLLDDEVQDNDPLLLSVICDYALFLDVYVPNSLKIDRQDYVQKNYRRLRYG